MDRLRCRERIRAAGVTAGLPVDSGPDESCAASGIDEASTDQPGVPEASTGYWYLVRGRNACGSGTYGHASDGSERQTAVCP